MTVDIAIITYKPEGIERLSKMQLPQMEGVRYVVSWQAHESASVPEELLRDDIVVYRFDKNGQSYNRNNAIEHCEADIVILSDDDVELRADGIRELIKVYEENPQIDFVTFKTQRFGAPKYPEHATKLLSPLPKNYHVACFELSFRRATAGWLRACPELGLNSPRMHGGEDEMILHTAIKRGLQCWFYPIEVCAHNHSSTGTKQHLTKENLRASGCVIALMYPTTAFLRVPLKAWRISRVRRASLLTALRFMLQGAFAARGVLKRNRDYLF